MIRKLKKLFAAAIWAIAIALSAKAQASDATRIWQAHFPIACKAAAQPAFDRGAVAIARAKALGSETERECELIDAVADY